MNWKLRPEDFFQRRNDKGEKFSPKNCLFSGTIFQIIRFQLRRSATVAVWLIGCSWPFCGLAGFVPSFFYFKSQSVSQSIAFATYDLCMCHLQSYIKIGLEDFKLKNWVKLICNFTHERKYAIYFQGFSGSSYVMYSKSNIFFANLSEEN